MNINIVIRSGLVTLLALSLSACDVEQYIHFILDPMTGELEGIEIPASWEETDVQNFGAFDASKASQHIVLWNVNWNGTVATDLVIQAYDETGQLLAASNTLEYQVDDTFTPFVLTIDPGDVSAANNFVNNLPTIQPAARGVDFSPRLYVERINPSIAVIVCVELYYDGFRLDFECDVLF